MLNIFSIFNKIKFALTKLGTYILFYRNILNYISLNKNFIMELHNKI